VGLNAPYNIARYRALTSGINWINADLVLAAWSGTPAFVESDDSPADIMSRGFAPLGESLPITSKTVSADGTAHANQVIIPDVPVGPPITWFTLSKGTPLSSSELILFIDEAIELPFVPNGLDIVVQPDWLSNRGWFRP